MYEGRSVAVIIPTYNEEGRVGAVIRSVPDFVDRIYAIDDASTDGTWSEIRRVAAAINGEFAGGAAPYLRRVVPIRHPHNRGAGGAVITGYEQALADGIDVTAVMDGDGQMDPSDLDRIVEPVASGATAYAKGNRLHQKEDRIAMSRWRLFGNGLLTMLTRIASGYWEMSDPQNGYTAISREALVKLPLDRLYERYGFLNDVLVHLNFNRERIADVSHRGKYGDETSGIRYRQFVPGLSRLLVRRFIERMIRMYMVRRFHPLSVCYVVGVVVIGIGIAGTVSGSAQMGLASLADAMSGIAVTTLGLLILLLGVTFDVQENEGLVVQRKRAIGDTRLEQQIPMASGEIRDELASDGGDGSSSRERDGRR